MGSRQVVGMYPWKQKGGPWYHGLNPFAGMSARGVAFYKISAVTTIPPFHIGSACPLVVVADCVHSCDKTKDMLAQARVALSGLRRLL